MEPQDLLIADLEHFGESIWRNEEVGEKRFNFFITLATAVAAGLVALWTAEGAPDKPLVDVDTLRTIAAASAGFLLVVGLLSQLRIAHRNRVTDEFQATLKYIREKYASAYKGWEYQVPRRPEEPKSLKEQKRLKKLEKLAHKYLKGGYAETMATINGMILVAFLMLLRVRVDVAAPVGGLFVLVVWIVACWRKK